MKWFIGRFKYAFQGLKDGVFHDKSVFLQMVFGLLTLGVASLFHCTKIEWMWILLCIMLVIVGEIFNSCIEKIVDYISLERNPQAKLIKDMAAAAVFLIAIFAFIIACMIFIPKLIG